MKLLVITLIMLLIGICHGGLFSWLFRKKKGEPQVHSKGLDPNGDNCVGDTGDAGGNIEVVVAVKIPFELTSTDEKFLMEAGAYTSLKLSELDVCHHKVILGLEVACGELSEEDLSRVAVNLLNCQSLAEGRPIFPCTSDMPLSACTRGMDGTAWNAYHIVSNRARAVCYAARQQQFTAHTQMAVNRLMASAQQQISSMGELQDGQEALGRATSETFDSLSSGHDQLRRQQNQLSSSHMAVHSVISSNLRELSREKKLIASGQRELAVITAAIKLKLDEAKEQLLSQENSQRDAHSLILHDLSTIQDNALKVWQNLDASTQKILLAHEETVTQYRQVTTDLERMNTTVHHLLDLLHSTKMGVENRLAWITALLGGADNTLAKLYSLILHAAYFLVAMVAASFLQVPYLTRLALVVLVPLNAVAEVKHNTSLPFSTLTTLLAFCIMVNLFSSFIWSVYKCQRKQKCVLSDEASRDITYQPLGVCPSPALTQLSPTHTLQETAPDSCHTSLGSNSSLHPLNLSGLSSCEVVRTEATADYSSDEDPPTPSPLLKDSLLRRRILGRISSSPKIVCVEEVDRSHVGEEECYTTTVATDPAAKTLSQVRRQLLDHLGSSRVSARSFNHSLDISATSLRPTPPASRCSTPSRSLTPRKLCTSVCRTGQMCRNTASGDTPHCHLHARASSRSSTPSRASRRSTPLLS